MLVTFNCRPLAVVGIGVAAALLVGCGGAQARKAKHLEKGQTFLVAGNYEKARVEFQNALQISPVDPEARYENGVVDEKLGKAREAAQYYQGAIDVSPNHLGARTALARLYLLSGASDRSLELLEPTIVQHPDDSELLALRAAVRVQKKDMAGALADGERAVELNRKNEDAYGTLAGIYVAERNFDKAQALLEEGIRQLPDSVELKLALAQVYGSESRPADGERMLLELVRLRPAEKSQRIRLAQFYSGQKQIDAAEKALRDGIKAIPSDRDLKLALIDFLNSRRSPEAAEKELQAMVAAAPRDVEMKSALAVFYSTNHQPDRAEKIYRDIIADEKLDAAGLLARDRLAVLVAQRNDTKGAEELIGQVLTKSPRDTDALILRGNIELARKDPKAAITDLRTVLRDQPNSIGVMRTLARAHMANGEPAIAEETMRRAVEANPKDPNLRLDLAQLLAELGRPEQAKPILVALIKEQPNNIQALDSLFRVTAGMKDYAAAQTAAEAIVAVRPKASVGYLYEGMLAEAEKRNDDAVRFYGIASDLQPDAIEPLQSQVRLLVSLKRIPEALKRLDQIIAAAPNYALAAHIKGELLLAQKDFGGAEAAYRMAIARAPKWWMPYRGLAGVELAQNNADSALTTLRAAEGTVDQADQIDLEIAAYYESVNKPQDAIHEYEKVVRRNPQSEVAANNLAMLLVTFQTDPTSLDRAKTLSARFADSTNLSYLDTYGWVLFKHGEAAASVPVLQRVVSKSPDAPVVLYHLGMAQSRAGSPGPAFSNLTRAVNSGAKFSGLDEAKATLDVLARSSGTTPKS